MDHEEHTRIQG